jgi:hypothetical protein
MVKKETSKKEDKKEEKQAEIQSDASSAAEKRKLSRASKDKCFWVSDGTVIRSVKEMAHTIDTMDFGVFQHHVSNDRNDFANWVKDVFGMETLSREMRMTQNKDRMVITILKHLVR